MLSKYELLKMLFEILAEIQGGGLTINYEDELKIKLALLYDILGEDVPEEYCDEIEQAM